MPASRRATVLACLTASLMAVGLLWRPITHFSTGLWGPSEPWTNGDFLGAYWMFWSFGQPEDWIARLHWPYGEGPLYAAFPNPFDTWLLAPLVKHLPFPLWWNLMELFHHLANVIATVVVVRAAGCRAGSAAAAGALVAATPAMLYEFALGHTITAAAWPGLLALAALLRGRSITAGLLIGIQGLCYLYTGLLFGVAALLIRPRWGLAAALLILMPYAGWLLPLLPAAEASGPPAGHTVLPLSGLFALDRTQSFFRLHPLLTAAFVVPALAIFRPELRVSWRWAAVAGFALFVALGPTVQWMRGEPALFTSPLAWILNWVPGVARLHHPVRAVQLLVPALAVLLALGLDRLPRWAIAIPLALAAAQWRVIDNTCQWNVDPVPRGVAAAAWVGPRGTAVIDLSSSARPALALQPVHRLPILTGFHPRHAPRPGIDTHVFQQVESWARGIPQSALPSELRALGFSHVLAIDRGPTYPLNTKAVEMQLGPPVYPGVYAL